MNKNDAHDTNPAKHPGKVESTQIPLLKDVVDLLVQHGGDSKGKTTNPRQGANRSKATAKKVISADSLEDPHYDPDTLDLFSDVYNSIQKSSQEQEELEDTINKLVDQYAQTVVSKLNADLIAQLRELSACLSETNSFDLPTTDDDND